MLNDLCLILIAFSCALLLTPLVRLIALKLGAVDAPGERKIHVTAVPRLGGISVILSVGVCLFVAAKLGLLPDMFRFDQNTWWRVFVGATLVFIIGVWDDIYPISAKNKFVWQAVAAASAVWFGARMEYLSWLGTTIDLGPFAIPVTLLWIVGLTNAFNLIDGLDGLAAGLGLIAAATSAIFCFMTGQLADGVLLIVLAGALAGFLVYNNNPATIFLGDSGSQFIGYVLAVTAIGEAQKASTALAVIIPLLIFGVPLLDTLLSMARRSLGVLRYGKPSHVKGGQLTYSMKRMFTADKDHIHHRLLAIGFSHRSAVLTLYAMSAGLSVLALMAVAAHYRNTGAILLIAIAGVGITVRRLGYDYMASILSRGVFRFYEQAVFGSKRSVAAFDSILVVLSFGAALLLTYDGLWSPREFSWYLTVLPFLVIIQLGVFSVLGVYRLAPRAMRSTDLFPLGLAVALGALLSYAISAVYDPPTGFQVVFCIHGLLLLTLMLGGRVAHKMLLESRRRHYNKDGEKVIIYGAGRRGESIVRELIENRDIELRPVGFLDDDPLLVGSSINGLRVLGSSRDLVTLQTTHKVTAVIISSPKIKLEHVSSVLSFCSEQGIAVFKGHFALDCIFQASGNEIERTSAIGRLVQTGSYT